LENSEVVHYSELSFLTSCGVAVLSAFGFRAYVTRQVSKVRDSYRLRQEGSVMQFRKPLALQRGQLSAFWFAVLVTFGTTAAGQALRSPLIFDINGLIGLSISFILLYLSGPDDIRLDGEQRTYERTVGWPWKPKTLFGSFGDVKGVCISPRNRVLLLLKKPDFVKSTGEIVLSSYGSDQAAYALAEELNREYGFPIVPCPKK